MMISSAAALAAVLGGDPIGFAKKPTEFEIVLKGALYRAAGDTRDLGELIARITAAGEEAMREEVDEINLEIAEEKRQPGAGVKSDNLSDLPEDVQELVGALEQILGVTAHVVDNTPQQAPGVPGEDRPWLPGDRGYELFSNVRKQVRALRPEMSEDQATAHAERFMADWTGQDTDAA